MKKQEVRGWIEEIGVIPAVRVFSSEDALFAAEAITRGGIPILEITLTAAGMPPRLSRTCAGSIPTWL